VVSEGITPVSKPIYSSISQTQQYIRKISTHIANHQKPSEVFKKVIQSSAKE